MRLRARVMKASSFTANFVDAHDETSNNDEICGRADERTGKRSGTTPEHVQSRYEEGAVKRDDKKTQRGCWSRTRRNIRRTSASKEASYRNIHENRRLAEEIAYSV